MDILQERLHFISRKLIKSLQLVDDRDGTIQNQIYSFDKKDIGIGNKVRTYRKTVTAENAFYSLDMIALGPLSDQNFTTGFA